MESLHIDSSTIAIVGSILVFLLGIISYFLNRLVKQFDALGLQFQVLNDTMTRIDKDLSGDVGLLKQQSASLHTRVKDLDPLWDRVRSVEADVAVVKAILKPVDFNKGSSK